MPENDRYSNRAVRRWGVPNCFDKEAWAHLSTATASGTVVAELGGAGGTFINLGPVLERNG